MLQEALPVKTTPRLVDHGIPEGVGEGQRNGVVPAIIVYQPKSGKGVVHYGRRVSLCRRILHAVQVIPLAKVMVQPQGADILYGIARQDSLEASRNSSVLRVDGGGACDL